MMRLTNAEQREIVTESYRILVLPNHKPMRAFMRRSAACGKLYTAFAFIETFNRIYATSKSKHNAYVATATTGKVAAAIGGVTVHSALKINMSGDDGLRHSDLNKFRLAFANVRLLVIYEVSMMGLELLAKVDSRMRQILLRRAI